MNNKYFIIEDIDLNNKNLLQKAYHIALYGAQFAPIKYAELVRAGISIITLKQAKRFINASNSEWKVNHIYYKHPRNDNILIFHKDYKDYLIREMVADIANYIQDHIPVTRLIIGIVSSNKNKLQGTVSTQELNAKATIKCHLDEKYIVNYGERVSNKEPKSDYIWIDKFPDIKSAVEHNNMEFESSKEVDIEFNLDIGVSVALGLLGNIKFYHKKKEALYIYYSTKY